MHRPNSPRANTFIAGAYASYISSENSESTNLERFNKADNYFRTSLELDPNNTSSIIIRIYLYESNNKALPAGILTSLKDNLSKLTIDASTVNALGVLTKCQIDKSCSLSDDEYFSIMRNAIKNPFISKRYLANIYSNIADYYHKVKKSHKQTIKFRELAILSVPNSIEFRLSLINSYVNAGLLDEALNSLNETRQLDNLLTMKSVFDKWETKITLLSTKKNQL